MFQRHPIQNNVPMLITTVLEGRKKLFLHSPYAREAVESLYRVQQLYPFFLFGFVIMPNHCHLLLNIAPPGSISKMMKSYKIGVGKSIGLGAIWQSRFHIKIPENIAQVLNYIHLNPVREGLCEQPENYPWSSASGKWDIASFEHW